jgi:hypothetical protein
VDALGAATLRPGGMLVLVDIHPLYTTLASVDPLRADFPYAFTGTCSASCSGRGTSRTPPRWLARGR